MPTMSSTTTTTTAVTSTPAAERKTLRAWRLARDMTIRELAAAASISESALWTAEAGTHTPRFAAVLRLAQALRISQDQIIWPKSFEQQEPRHKGRRRGPTSRPEVQRRGPRKQQTDDLR